VATAIVIIMKTANFIISAIVAAQGKSFFAEVATKLLSTVRIATSMHTESDLRGVHFNRRMEKTA
jgi:hypothetical protein